MARTVPGGLATHLVGGSSNLVQAVRITRNDGTVQQFTESESPWGAFASHPSIQTGSIPYGLDGFSSGVDIEFGAADSEFITPDDIRDGAYDAAEVEIFEYDAANVGLGSVQIFWGRVASVQRTVEGRAKIAAKGLLAQSHQIVVERYSPQCIWFFCDDRCGYPAASVTFTGTITAIPDPYILTVSGAIAGRPDNVFKDGVIEITSGVRVNLKVEVRESQGGTIKTFLAHPRGLAVGDTVEAIQGCQKTPAACKAYNNFNRYGGQPYAGNPEEAANVTYQDWG